MMSHRLWFRLALPLAEHAMACPVHRVTAAQALAGAALRPALVWAGTPLLDVSVLEDQLLVAARTTTAVAVQSALSAER